MIFIDIENSFEYHYHDNITKKNFIYSDRIDPAIVTGLIYNIKDFAMNEATNQLWASNRNYIFNIDFSAIPYFYFDAIPLERIYALAIGKAGETWAGGIYGVKNPPS